jgi:hypothetical protein
VPYEHLHRARRDTDCAKGRQCHEMYADSGVTRRQPPTISLRCPLPAIHPWKTERRRKATRMNVGDRAIRRGPVTVSPQSQEMDTKRLDPQFAFLRLSILSPCAMCTEASFEPLPLGASTQDQGREVV